MEINLPKINKVRIPLSKTYTEFHYNEMMRYVLGTQYKLDILPQVHNWITIKVTDGKRKINHVEIFDSTGKFGSYSCSCEEYIKDQSGFCKHVIAVKLVGSGYSAYVKTPGFQIWYREFVKQYLKLPKNKQYNTKIMIENYNPADNTLALYGISPDKIIHQSNSTKTYKLAKKNVNCVNVLPVTSADQVTDLLNKPYSLYDYQQDILIKMLNSGRAICSMNMGLGKTIATIGATIFIKKLNADKQTTTLIICPKSLKIQWAKEYMKFAGYSTIQINKAADIDDFIKSKVNNKIGLATYQLITRNPKEFAKIKYNLIVADEVQMLRNSDTKVWKTINKLTSDYFFGLSGTVIENRLDDLYSIMQIINPDLLGPKWKFDGTYQNIKSIAKNKILFAGLNKTNLSELKKKVKPYVFSHEQTNFPPISHTQHLTKMSSEEKEQHDYYHGEALKLIAQSLTGKFSFAQRMMIYAMYVKARQASNSIQLISKNWNIMKPPSAKIQKFLELINKICVIENKKIVVFSEWVEFLELLQKYTAARYPAVGHVFFTGKVSAKKRDENLNKFQTDPKCKIFFSTDSGGLGLDGLQLVSSDIVHSEIPWNAARIDQRNGRLHRLGQTNNVNVHYLISEMSIETKINKLLGSKRDIRKEMIFNL